MIENYEQRKAFGLSLGLHFVLFLIAAAMGLFSAAAPTAVQHPPIDVFLYDGGGDAGAAPGDDLAPAAPAVSFPDDIVLEDKTVVQEERQAHSAEQSAGCIDSSGTGGKQWQRRQCSRRRCGQCRQCGQCFRRGHRRR